MANKKSAHIYLTISFLTALVMLVCSTGLLYSASAQTIWNPVSSGTVNTLHSVVFANNLFVAVGANGTIRTSTNGTTWTAGTSGTTAQLWDITYGRNLFVAVGENQTIITSSNGITWTNANIPITGTLYKITYCNGMFAATGSTSTTGSGLLYTSTDGMMWPQQSPPANPMWGMGAANGKLFAWQPYSYVTKTDTARFFSSADAATWTPIGKNTLYKVEGIAYGKSTYVVVGDMGAIYSSSNGTTWTQRTSGTTNTLLGVVFYNNTFFAVGSKNTILSSADGISWTNILPADTSSRSLSTLAYGAAVYVAVGSAGEILVSGPNTFQAPTLTAPANAAIVASTATTTLTWTTISGATSYYVQGSTSSSFTSLSIEDSTLTSASKAISHLPVNLYYWRVRAKNSTTVSAWSASRYFSVTSSSPGTPAPISPVSGSNISTASAQLTWSTAANAASYRVQVGTSTAFTSTVTDTISSITTRYQYSLALNIKYYWRVAAMNGMGLGSWSSVSYFTTIGGLPVMTLVSPLKAATIIKDSVLLVWNKAPQGATQYAVQLAVDSAMTIFIINNATYTDTSLMVRALSPGTHYWWRVKGYNSSGWGSYSAKKHICTYRERHTICQQLKQKRVCIINNRKCTSFYAPVI